MTVIRATPLLDRGTIGSAALEAVKKLAPGPARKSAVASLARPPSGCRSLDPRHAAASVSICHPPERRVLSAAPLELRLAQMVIPTVRATTPRNSAVVRIWWPSMSALPSVVVGVAQLARQRVEP